MDEERKIKRAKTEMHPMPEDLQDTTVREDLERDGHEGVAASSGLTEEERKAGQEPIERSEKRRRIAEALDAWDEMDVLELYAEEMMPDELETMDPEAFDGRTGENLDPELVKRAKAEEIEFMKKIELFDEVPVSECWEWTWRARSGWR